MSWVSLVLALVQGLSSLITWMHERQIISDAEKALIATAMEKQSLVIKGAIQARKDQSTANDATPKSDSLPDDGFRRD